MEEWQQILQQARDMLADMDAELRSGLAVMKRTAGTMAAARCYEGRTETKTEGRSGIPVCDGKGDLEKQDDGQSRTRHRDGTSNRCNNRQGGATTSRTATVDKHSPGKNGGRPEMRGGRTMERPEEQRSKLEKNNQPQKTTIIIGVGENKRCRGGPNPVLEQKTSEHTGRRIQAQTDRVRTESQTREHDQELKQSTMATETQDKASKTGKLWVKLRNQACKARGRQVTNRRKARETRGT